MRIVNESEVSAALRALGTDEPRVFVSGNYGTPRTLLRILDESVERFRLFALNAQSPWIQRDGVINETPFIGPGMRSDPRIRYLPARLSLVPTMFQRGFEPDVVLVQTSPPRHGRVSLGIEVNIVPAAIESAKRHGRPVIAQINPRMPFTFGDGEIALEDIDLAIEIDEALPSPAARRINDTAIAIGEHVARYVEDGSTLQLGIGDIPDAALGQLNHRRHLGVWSEMISDGVLNLERRGVLDTHKPITCSFMFGSPELYEWANANERLLLRRTDIVNDPAEIESRASLVAVNTAVQIDLYAQANATFVRGTVYSGFGGQPDFVSGALHSPRGHAIIALRSWHDPSDASCVVPLLNTPVTTFQHSVLISEQGAAEIFGRSRPEQSELIIDNVAHPRVRDELREAAATLG